MIRKILDKLTGKDINDAYYETFNTKSGKIVLAHLAKLCRLGNTTFCGNDPYETAMREGSRRVVLEIIQRLNMKPLDLIQEDN